MTVNAQEALTASVAPQPLLEAATTVKAELLDASPESVALPPKPELVMVRVFEVLVAMVCGLKGRLAGDTVRYAPLIKAVSVMVSVEFVLFSEFDVTTMLPG